MIILKTLQYSILAFVLNIPAKEFFILGFIIIAIIVMISKRKE